MGENKSVKKPSASKLDKFKLHYEDNANTFKPSDKAGKKKSPLRRFLHWLHYTTYNFYVNVKEAIAIIYKEII